MSSPTRTVVRIVYYVADVIIIVLTLRFLLRLFDANASNAFVSFIYSISETFLAPFRGIFPPSAVEGSTIEWSTLVAIALYGIGAYLIGRLITTVTKVSDTTHEEDAHE